MVRRLSERLARLPAPRQDSSNTSAKAQDEGLEKRTATERHRTPLSLAAFRDWQFIDTPQGPCRVWTERLPRPDCPHVPELGRWLADARLVGFRADQALYLDIEATGLSHGAGTLAFLVGLAYFEDEHLVFQQLFVAEPSEERAALAYFLALLDRFEALVSFNGKSYDLSVLQSRLVMNRFLSEAEGSIKLRPHLDLLHVSRQAYRDILPDGKLQTLERAILRLDPSLREDDVPGSLVPALYFHFLRTADARALEVVFKHNRTDVLSMVQLTRHLLTLHADPDGHPAQVLYNLGRAALRRKLPERAMRLLRLASKEPSLPLALQRQLWSELVTAERRQEHWAAAAQAAQRAYELTPAEDTAEGKRLQRQIQRYQRRSERQSKDPKLDTAAARP